MKAQNLLLMVLSIVSMQCVHGSAELASQRLNVEAISKNGCSDFSEQELHAITSQLDVLFRAPVDPTPEWNAKVSPLLDRLPYSKYNRMYNSVMGATYKKAINQKFYKYQQQELAKIRQVNK